MAVSYKVEGSKLLIEGEIGTLVDNDQDGSASMKGSVALKLELDGLEIADELLKSSDLLKSVKEKLGLG